MNKEDTYRARNVSLYDYFVSRGYSLSYSGSDERGDKYKVNGYQGLYIQNCTYYRFSTCTKGNSIDCLMNEFGFSFEDAVTELIGDSSNSGYPINLPAAKKHVTKPFIMPELANNQRRVIAYLTKTRGISSEVIVSQIRKHNLFQDIRGNIVFPTISDNGTIIGAEVVGTLDQIRFKQIIEGSSVKECFKISFGDPKKFFFFESGIEVLSFISLGHDCTDSVLFSLAGLKYEPILRLFELFPNAEFFNCVNNDLAGNRFSSKLSEHINFERLVPFQDSEDDWNDLLLKSKEV